MARVPCKRLHVGDGQLQAQPHHHGLPLRGKRRLGRLEPVLDHRGERGRVRGARSIGGVALRARRAGLHTAPVPADRQRAAARHQLGARAQAVRAAILLPGRQCDLRAAVPLRRFLPLWLRESNAVPGGLLLPRGRLCAHPVRGRLRLQRGGPVRAALVLAHGHALWHGHPVYRRLPQRLAKLHRFAHSNPHGNRHREPHALGHRIGDANAQRNHRPRGPRNGRHLAACAAPWRRRCRAQRRIWAHFPRRVQQLLRLPCAPLHNPRGRQSLRAAWQSAARGQAAAQLGGHRSCLCVLAARGAHHLAARGARAT